MTNEKAASPTYGVLERYGGERGASYFQQQSPGSIQRVKYNHFIYDKYVSVDDDVLDFGCGGGFLLDSLKAKTKIGVEINPAARACAETLGLSVVSKLDEIKDRQFSRILTSHALEHIPNPYQALVDLKRLLKPGGLLVWLSPLDDWRSRNNRTWKPNDKDMHLYTWTPRLIGNLLSAAGYEPQSISVLTHAVPPRGDKLLWRLSPTLFHLAARATAVLLKRRQILSVSSLSQ